MVGNRIPRPGMAPRVGVGVSPDGFEVGMSPQRAKLPSPSMD